jgi:hypothetical protein
MNKLKKNWYCGVLLKSVEPFCSFRMGSSNYSFISTSICIYAWISIKQNQMSITWSTAVKKICREEWRTFIRPNILLIQVVWLLRLFTKLLTASVSFIICQSFRMWRPLDRFPWNFTLGTFIKIPWETPNLGKIGHFTWRPKYVLLVTATLNCHKSSLFKRNGIRLLGCLRTINIM